MSWSPLTTGIAVNVFLLYIIPEEDASNEAVSDTEKDDEKVNVLSNCNVSFVSVVVTSMLENTKKYFIVLRL